MYITLSKFNFLWLTLQITGTLLYVSFSQLEILQQCWFLKNIKYGFFKLLGAICISLLFFSSQLVLFFLFQLHKRKRESIPSPWNMFLHSVCVHCLHPRDSASILSPANLMSFLCLASTFQIILLELQNWNKNQMGGGAHLLLLLPPFFFLIFFS